MATVTARLAE